MKKTILITSIALVFAVGNINAATITEKFRNP